MKRYLAFGIIAALAACNPKPPLHGAGAATPTASSTAVPPLRVSGHGTAKQPVRIVGSEQKGNRKQYDLLARSFVSNGPPASATVTFKIVHVTFYAKSGTRLVADAPRAVLDQTANTVLLEGGVHAHNSAGVKLTCDQLVFNRATELLHGTGHVTIVSPSGLRATGSEFDSNVTLSDARMQ
jgi:lipopolysaccharide assembly outer membrane protein LptD (OstA)